MICVRPILPLLFLAPLCAAAIATAQSPAAEADFPEGEGRDTFLRVCADCHAPQIASHQRLTREGWSDLVFLMADQGAVATDEELEQIIDYLSGAYPPEGGEPAHE